MYNPNKAPHPSKPEKNDNEKIAMSQEEAQHEAELMKQYLAKEGVTQEPTAYDYEQASRAIDRLKQMAADEPEVITAIAKGGKVANLAAYIGVGVPASIALAFLETLVSNFDDQSNPHKNDSDLSHAPHEIFRGLNAELDTAKIKIERLEKAARTREQEGKVYHEQYGEAA